MTVKHCCCCESIGWNPARTKTKPEANKRTVTAYLPSLLDKAVQVGYIYTVSKKGLVSPLGELSLRRVFRLVNGFLSWPVVEDCYHTC